MSQPFDSWQFYPQFKREKQPWCFVLTSFFLLLFIYSERNLLAFFLSSCTQACHEASNCWRVLEAKFTASLSGGGTRKTRAGTIPSSPRWVFTWKKVNLTWIFLKCYFNKDQSTAKFLDYCESKHSFEKTYNLRSGTLTDWLLKDNYSSFSD